MRKRKPFTEEVSVTLVDLFVEDYGVPPAEAQAAILEGRRLLALLEKARHRAIEALIDEDNLTPDGYRLQGLIRGIDMIQAIPDRIKQLNTADNPE